MKTVTAPSYTVQVFIAGPLHRIEDVCREFCYREGLCVSVEPTRFIYTGGEETGAAIRLVNYPRFPTTPRALALTARRLAKELIEKCHQETALVVSPKFTRWITRRKD